MYRVPRYAAKTWPVLLAALWFALFSLIPIAFFRADPVVGTWDGIGVPMIGAALAGALVGSSILMPARVSSEFEALLLGAAVSVTAHLICSLLWAIPSDGLVEYLGRAALLFCISLTVCCGVSLPAGALGGWLLFRVFGMHEGRSV